jgi:hypothetical protein
LGPNSSTTTERPERGSGRRNEGALRLAYEIEKFVGLPQSLEVNSFEKLMLKYLSEVLFPYSFVRVFN